MCATVWVPDICENLACLGVQMALKKWS